VCPECGLDYDTVSPGDAAVAVRSFPRRYRALLTGFGNDDDDPDSVIRRRPDPTTWSALEYTAHVADVLDEIGVAVRRIVVEDEPALTSSVPDRRVAEKDYNAMDRMEVLGWLELVCAGLAEQLEGVRPDDWSRIGRFDWGERDALAMTRNAVHEGSHHLRDVQRVLSQVRGRPPA
jgi:hypothetical protein